MKPVCYDAKGNPKPLTKGQLRRNERAALHQKRRGTGYRGDYLPCERGCGGNMSWCGCCEMYSSGCCVDYGTCACS